MKKFSEKLKDMLYASIDYLIMLSIIVAVVLIIGWRLDILFQEDVISSVIGENTEIEEPKKDKNIAHDIIEDEEKPKDDMDTENTKDDTNENNTEETKPKEKSKKIKIEIPEGSFPAQIASILQSNGIIENNTDFIKKAVDLQLDTQLKSGVFTISDDDSLEKIVKIIAKKEPSN